MITLAPQGAGFAGFWLHRDDRREQFLKLQIKAVASPRNHRQLTPRSLGFGEFLFAPRVVAKGQDLGQVAVEGGSDALTRAPGRSSMRPISDRSRSAASALIAGSFSACSSCWTFSA
jgi:hypothetical protein